MKVLLVNGSPHREGCTYTALCTVSEALNQNGIDTDIFWIGNKPLSDVSPATSAMICALRVSRHGERIFITGRGL